jgi:uncharacterized protein YukE
MNDAQEALLNAELMALAKQIDHYQTTIQTRLDALEKRIAALEANVLHKEGNQ